MVQLEALVDTASGVTLMSTKLFTQVQAIVTKMDKTLQIKKCSQDIQAYSPVGTRMEHVALLQLSMGPISLIHPVYISPLNSIPLLIGKDLLNRFEPLIDFQRLKNKCRTLYLWF